MMWNWLVSALAVGAAAVLFDGSPTYPDARVLWRIADQEKLTVFGTSARYLAAIEKESVRPREEFRLDALRTILSTGSPLAPEGFEYVYRDIKSDVQLAVWCACARRRGPIGRARNRIRPPHRSAFPGCASCPTARMPAGHRQVPCPCR